MTQDLFDGEINSILALSVASISGHLITPVRSRQNVRQDCQADLLRRFQIDHKLKLVGCSTGRSAGLAPFRILST
jgi:hypothetical protein